MTEQEKHERLWVKYPTPRMDGPLGWHIEKEFCDSPIAQHCKHWRRDEETGLGPWTPPWWFCCFCGHIQRPRQWDAWLGRDEWALRKQQEIEAEYRTLTQRAGLTPPNKGGAGD